MNAIEDKIKNALVQGDMAALEMIWNTYAADLLGWLLAFTGSRHDAEDFLQEVFVKIARNRETVASARNLRAYLFAMARNTARHTRQRRAREDLFGDDGDAWLVPAAPAAASDADAMAAALDGLPEEQRTVVTLKVYREQTFREIAEALGISLNTAASRFRYALEKLRERLGEDKP